MSAPREALTALERHEATIDRYGSQLSKQVFRCYAHTVTRRPHATRYLLHLLGLYILLGLLGARREDIRLRVDTTLCSNHRELFEQRLPAVLQSQIGHIRLRAMIIRRCMRARFDAHTLWISLPAAPGRYHCCPSQCRLTSISKPL